MTELTTASDLCYEASGSGPLAVYLHGLGDTGQLPQVLPEHRPERTWVRPSHPGFLQNREVAAESIRDIAVTYVGFIESLLATRDESRCALVGASLGGWIGAEMLLLAPDLFSSVTFLAPAGIDERGTAPGILEQDAESVLRLAARPAEPASFPAASLAAMAENLAAARRIVGAARLVDPTLVDRLKEAELTAAVQLFWGEHDAVIPRDIAQDWRGALPNSTVTILPGVGHGILGSRGFDLSALAL